MNLRSLNFGLDETLIALQDSVAAFCAKEIAPIAQQVDQDNKFPSHLWKKFGDMGLLGLTVSEEYVSDEILDKVGSGDCFMAGLIYGFYNHLIEHMQKMFNEDFLYEYPEDRIVFVNEPAEIFA